MSAANGKPQPNEWNGVRK